MRLLKAYILFVYLAAYCAAHEPTTGTAGLFGTVTDSTGASIPNAKIIVSVPGDKPQTISVDDQGDFLLRDRAPVRFESRHLRRASLPTRPK
jgi:hypothetical protein